MFSSLRSRLWLSYALLITAALSVVAIILFIFLLQNPLLYRQANTRLSVVQAVLVKSQNKWANLYLSDLQAHMEDASQTYDTRLLLFSADRQVLLDSGAGKSAAIQLPRFTRLRSNSVLKDASGVAWLYALKRLDNGNWLMVATERPNPPLVMLLRDEFFWPFVTAGLVAFILSLLLAYWLARWVGDPLQTVVTASRQMPSAEAKPLALRGPREVRDLMHAFNEMTTRVQASQKSQRDFVANVSHELKTPLTSVQGFAQAILDGTAGTPEARQQAARVIYDEAGRMHRMVLALLDLARLDAGTAEFQRAPVDIPALLDSVVEKFTPQARGTGITLRIETPVLPPITGDGDRLAQVFTNLVDNALKFTPARGQVTLRAALIGSEVQVDVADSGAGIPAEALTHIFDRFYQADPSRPGGGKHGAGLGLAIVKEIVQAHGGTISVRSTPGEGSTFTVRLPLVPPADKPLAKRKK
jgi:signal transduction histidine kinase